MSFKFWITEGLKDKEYFQNLNTNKEKKGVLI